MRNIIDNIFNKGSFDSMLSKKICSQLFFSFTQLPSSHCWLGSGWPCSAPAEGARTRLSAFVGHPERPILSNHQCFLLTESVT